MRIVVTLGLVLFAAQAEAADLCVKTGGSDATAKASLVYTAGNEAGSTCWATLGRAVWGDDDRSTPSSAEGAAAGDTVYVFGGTYTSNVALDSRNLTVYTTVNDGTSGNPIVYRCVGDCVLTAPAANSVLLGQGDNYIEWRADIALGHSWQVSTCYEDVGGSDLCGAGTAAATPDFSSVACINATGLVLEGFEITGSAPAPAGATNWNGIRLEGCQSSVVRNNRIADITRSGGGNHNQSIFTLYRVNSVLMEHNHGSNSNACVYYKDTAVASPVMTGNIFRYNLCDDTGEGLTFSLVNPGSVADVNYFYQNVFRGGTYGIRFIGDADDGARNMVFANNLFYDHTYGLGFGLSTGLTGNQVVNNIFLTAATNMLRADASVAWPSASAISLQHNVYNGFPTFYTGSDGSLSFAAFNSAYANQNDVSPASVTSDPLIVDAAGADYRLCTGSGTPDAGCSGASPALALGVDLLDLDGDGSTSDNIPAGPYVTGDEVIGLDSDGVSVPDAPTIGTATPGVTQCAVAFTAPGSDGGSAITGYTVTSSPGGFTATGAASPLTVTGLTNGVGYTFTAVATNAEGNSSASGASNLCTPLSPSTSGPGRLRIRGEN